MYSILYCFFCTAKEICIFADLMMLSLRYDAMKSRYWRSVGAPQKATDGCHVSLWTSSDFEISGPSCSLVTQVTEDMGKLFKIKSVCKSADDYGVLWARIEMGKMGKFKEEDGCWVLSKHIIEELEPRICCFWRHLGGASFQLLVYGIAIWVRIFIKAIKHCRKHLRLIPY